MKSAATECGENNITVSALIPGLVDSRPHLPRETAQRKHGPTGAEGRATDPAPGAGQPRSDTLPLKVGLLQQDDISPATPFWIQKPGASGARVLH
jgi:NAD(P)-dependent dehydrogenase (short-subunit alcohol dehydrogenase family)